jgi:colicin import membrane protein
MASSAQQPPPPPPPPPPPQQQQQHRAERLKLSQQTAARAGRVCASVADVLERMLSDARPLCRKLSAHAATTHDVSLTRCHDAFAAVEASGRALAATAPAKAPSAKPESAERGGGAAAARGKEQWEASAESTEVSAELLSLSVTAGSLAARVAAFSARSETRFLSRMRAARAVAAAAAVTESLLPGARVLTRCGAGEVRRANSGWNSAFVEIELDWGGLLFTQAAALAEL